MNAIADVMDDATTDAAEAARKAVPTTDDALAARVLELHKLPELDYGRRRKVVAAELGIPVGMLDAAVKAARMASGEEQARASQRDELVAIAVKAGVLWRDEAEDAYATVSVDGHLEHYKVRSAGYRRWLTRRYGDEHTIQGPSGPIACAPGSQAMTEALAAIEANAGRGPLDFPRLRIAGSVKSGALELDLCAPDWRAVRVDREGWTLVAEPAARFMRAPGMLPLPDPVRGDGLAKLRRHLAIRDEASERLVLGFLIGCLCPRGPYPILAIHGEQGSGKSTLVRKIRRLVDPNRAGDRSRPKDEQDLVIAATNSWLVCFDNLSRIDDVLSDALCRIATGAGFGTRTLYTNGEETLFQVCRPQMVNGIPDLARSGDLVDRCITVMLPTRAEADMAFEADMWAEFEADLPEMLGFLLDVVSCALRRLDSVKLAERPRLADFARWVEASAPAFGWTEGKFLGDYLENRAAGAAAVVEGDLLASLIQRVLDFLKEPFSGTATDLLAQMAARASEDEKRSSEWPKNGQVLSGRLRRLAPALRKTGIDYSVGGGRARRTIHLESLPKSPSPASPASPARNGNGLAVTGSVTESVIPPASASPSDGLHRLSPKSVTESVTKKPSVSAASDARDARDAVLPALSKSLRRAAIPPVSEIDL